MGELAHPYNGREAQQITLVDYVDPRVSDDIPTSEYGIVVLENPRHCMTEACHIHGQANECFLDLDHLHHSEAYYAHHSALAEEFRDQEALTRWVFRCVHEQKHKRFPYNVPFPNLTVMKGAIKEARFLREMEANYRARTSLRAALNQLNMERWYIKATRKHLDEEIKKSKKLIKSVDNIEFLPQEIVAGALLLVSPGHAEDKLIANPAFMLPGTIRRQDVKKAWQVADEILARCEERNRTLEQADTLDREYVIAAAAA